MRTKFTLKKHFLSMLLVLTTILTAFPAITAQAANDENYNGGQAYAFGSNIPVYSSTSWTNQIGTIYSYEGYTVLYSEVGYLKVEYSTSSGPRQGYVRTDGSETIFAKTCVAKVLSNSTLYYGPSSTVNPVAGSVSAGELVTVLAKNDNWVYVEYNTNAGRKRGYMSYSNLYCYNRPGVFYDLYNYNNPGTTTYYSGTYNVYAGPSSRYVKVGSISNENVTVLGYEYIDGVHQSVYIEYNIPGSGATRKSGFLVFGP